MIQIVNCDNPECPKEWDKLSESGDRMIRICTACFKAVYLCETPEEAPLHEASGHKAAVKE